LEAWFLIENTDVVMLSSGGTQNKDYAPGLLLILERLSAASIGITDAWVDSSTVQELPLDARSIFEPAEGLQPSQILRMLTRRMARVRSDPTARAKGGNSRKRIRIRTDFQGSEERLLTTVQGPVPPERLPVETLNLATADYVWEAVQQLSKSKTWEPFSPSTDFDLIADDMETRLPPKAVFGRALTLALDGEPVWPYQFTAGLDSPCFRLLRAAGYMIVRKDELPPDRPAEDEEGTNGTDERTWKEGSVRMAAHSRRERGHGLAKAKKAQFLKQHGRLRCEACGMTPSEEYGTDWAESCIEVHHATTQVSEMAGSHETRLSDLECVCANCHRLIHRHIREGQATTRFSRTLPGLGLMLSDPPALKHASTPQAPSSPSESRARARR